MNFKTKKKIRYIWDYYKLPIAIALILLYIGGSMLNHHIKHRDMILYTACVNISSSDELNAFLKEDFLADYGADLKKEDMTLYSGLYLTSDTDSEYYGYSYASEMKIIAALEAKQLDVVLMDREAFDAFSVNGYLMDLEDFLPSHMPEFYETQKANLVNNIVILSDNADEVRLDSSITYEAETDEAAFGLNLSESSFFKKFGFSGDLYLGILKETPRPEAVAAYIEYLY